MSSYHDIMLAIGDPYALSMLDAMANNEGRFMISDLKLTKKQYYSRLAKLQTAGLIRRNRGNYVLTLFGVVVYNALKIVLDASANRWKIEAVDFIRKNNGNAKEETRQAIELLVTNHGVKHVLLREVELNDC